MGFLDLFDNVDAMSSLLGIPPTVMQGANAAPQMQPPMAPPMPPKPPAMTQPPGPIGNPAGDYMAGVPGAPDPSALPPTLAPTPPTPPTPPTLSQADMASPPMPRPDPRMTSAAAPVGEPLSLAPPFPGPTEAAAPGPPLSLAPPSPGPGMPPAPPMMPGAPPTPGAAPANKFNGLASMLGIPQAIGSSPDDWRARMSGIGKGLSAVGAMRPGAPMGASIAAGLGGSLQGTAAAQEQQKKLLFDQSSTAFKDMLAAKQSDNTSVYRDAQSKYLLARAQALMTGAGPNGSRAMLATPDGKVAYVESQALKFRDQLRKSAEAKAKATGMPLDEDQIEKDTNGYRQRLYKQFKIDPDQAEKIKTMGTSQSNPFDTKGMTIEQFHQSVPMGAWYKAKDKNGNDVILQRTVPPPGAANPPAPGANVNAAPNYDDMAAMAPAA